MTLPFSVHPAAAAEAERAHDRYEDEAAGLGQRFAEEVARVLALVCEVPGAGPPEGRKGRRRVRLDGFPYALVYRVEAEAIRVLAVPHEKRRPGYYRTRA